MTKFSMVCLLLVFCHPVIAQLDSKEQLNIKAESIYVDSLATGDYDGPIEVTIPQPRDTSADAATTATARIGQLVVLDVSSVEGDSYAWKLPNSDAPFLVVENGSKLVFASEREGVFHFVVAVSVSDSPVRVHQRTVKIGTAHDDDDHDHDHDDDEDLVDCKFCGELLDQQQKDLCVMTCSLLPETVSNQSIGEFRRTVLGLRQQLVSGTLSANEVKAEIVHGLPVSWTAWVKSFREFSAGVTDWDRLLTNLNAALRHSEDNRNG